MNRGTLLAAILLPGWALLASPMVFAQDVVGNVQNGKAVYERHCLRCHGLGGHGDGTDGRKLIVPPANFHSFRSQTKSDEQLLTSIEFGLALSPMHGWHGRLTDREMQDVVAYIRLLMQRAE